jgi:hypothetical protein
MRPIEKDARWVTSEFFKKFPLKHEGLLQEDWEFFLEYLWLRGFKIQPSDGEAVLDEAELLDLEEEKK